MAKKLADQLRTTADRADVKAEKARKSAAAERAGRETVREAWINGQAEERAPDFIEALTEKLKDAAKVGRREESIRWTSYDQTQGAIARRAMEIAEKHFAEEEGLATELTSRDNAHSGAANGEEGIRDWVPATEWTTVLKASLPESGK